MKLAAYRRKCEVSYDMAPCRLRTHSGEAMYRHSFFAWENRVECFVMAASSFLGKGRANGGGVGSCPVAPRAAASFNTHPQ